MNWKQKFTSRKFLMAIIGFITAVCSALGFSGEVTAQAVSVVSAVLVLIAYIIGEGVVDAKREGLKADGGTEDENLS